MDAQMNRRLLQVSGLIRYELRMQWRRRALFIIALGIALGLLAGGLQRRASTRDWQAYFFKETLPPELAPVQATFDIGVSVEIMLWFLILGVPFIVAETIPLDVQYGVREMLDALPVSRGTYLTGKLLGVWAGISMVLMISGALYGLTGYFLHGPYEPEVYVSVWAIAIWPVALFTSGMGLLLAAGQPTRRRAIAVGSLFVAVCFFRAMGTFRSVFLSLQKSYLLQFGPDILMIQEVGDGGFSIRSSLNLGPAFDPAVQPERLPLTLAVLGLLLGLTWLLAWAWLRWKEGR